MITFNRRNDVSNYREVSLEDFSQVIPGGMDRYTGIRSLWLKVIIRAMFDLASYRDSPKLVHKKLAENAKAWLFEPNELFNSFESICKFLELDIKKIRVRASMMTKDDVAKIEFKERKGVAEIGGVAKIEEEEDEGF